MATRVYFIRDGQFVKIGKTTRPVKERLAELQTGNPRPLELMHVCRARRSLERELHEKFEALRIENTEWFFDRTQRIRRYVGLLKKKARAARKR